MEILAQEEKALKQVPYYLKTAKESAVFKHAHQNNLPLLILFFEAKN